MSAEHVAWVYRYSPARGARFTVHQAIADSVNDQHNHEFWMRLGKLAEKSRLSRSAVQAGVAWLVEHELLLNVEGIVDRRAAGHPILYRFLFPDLPVIYETRRPRDESARSTSRREREVKAQPRDESARTSRREREGISNPSRSQESLTQSDLALQLSAISTPQPTFDDFWAVFPVKNGKKAAGKAWTKAVLRADPSMIIEAARRYAADPNRDPGHTKWAQGWLNDDRWEDPALQAKTKQMTPTERTIANLNGLMEGGSNGRRPGPQATDRGSQRGLPN